MRKAACWFLAPLLLGFLQTSCASDDDSSAGVCGAFSACGGSLEGTWDAVEFCVTGDLLAARNNSAADQSTSCASLFRDIAYEYVVSSIEVPPSQAAIAGSIRYTGRATQFLTDSCSLDLMGTEVSPQVCDQYESVLVSNQEWTEASCVGRVSCSCDGHVEPDATTLVFDSSSGSLTASGEPVPYCVRGDTLRVLDRSRATDIVVEYRRRTTPGY